MRVALLTPPTAGAAPGSSYAKIARGLGERGHTVHLVTAVRAADPRLERMGLPVTEMPGRNTGPREVWALLRVLRAIRAEPWWWTSRATSGSPPMATLVRPARIVYRYNLNYRRPRNDLMDRALPPAGRARASTSRARSGTMRPRARRGCGRIRGFRIPNGYDLDRYAPRPEAGRAFRERYGIAARCAAWCSPRRSSPGTRVTRSRSRRWAGCTPSGVPLVYLICGDGGREAELRALARSARLPAVFTGLLESDEMVARARRGGRGGPSLAQRDLPQRGR